jgi:hypothetical protein
MRTTSRKYSYLLGLILASAPIFAQSLPYGLNQTDQASQPTNSAQGNLKGLDGRYTFEARGVDHESHKVALAGAFVADGKGHITNGEEDFSSVDKALTQLTLHGSYNLDANGAGTLTLETSEGATQSFSFFLSPALAGSQSASLVADDSVFGVHGTLNKQVSLPLPLIGGSYSFNLDGQTPDADVMTLAGTLTIPNFVTNRSINGLTAIYAHFDENDPTFMGSFPFKGELTQRPDQFGRFVISLSFTSDGPPATLAAYVSDGFHLNLLSIAKVAEETPSLSGFAIR